MRGAVPTGLDWSATYWPRDGLVSFSPAKVSANVDKPSVRADHAATASTVNPPRDRKGGETQPVDRPRSP